MSHDDWEVIFWLALMAGLGGLVRYLERLKTGRFSARNAAIAIAASSFAGVIVGLTAIAAGLPMPAVLAMSGLSGHYGTRILTKLLPEHLRND